MIDGGLVVDAVAHGFDYSLGNRAEQCPAEHYQGFQQMAHQMLHVPTESLEPGFQLTAEEFLPAVSAEAVASSLLLESDVDLAFYHHVPISAFFKDGISRLDTGLELCKLAPNRVYLYGGVDTFLGDRGAVLASMEELADQGAVGFKFYPSNGSMDPASGRLMTMLYDDPETAYPYFEKARELGIRHLAFHKGFPVGPSVDAIRVGDMLNAAVAFPDMTFEIVHAGWAFLEETALELMVAPNIYANLELTGSLIVRRPKWFARTIGHLIQTAGWDRIVFASGCVNTHVDPALQAFWNFEMPDDLQEDFGYPQLTPDMKRDILGRNMLRLHGLDAESVKRQIEDDEWARRRQQGKQEPWSVRRAEVAAAATG